VNILFLSLSDFDSLKKSGIYTDILRSFSNKGRCVYAVSPAEKRNKVETQTIINDNAQILKVKIGNITKCGLIEKGISTLRIEAQYIKAIKKYYADVHFDLILYSTPPITFGKVIEHIKKRDHAKSYLLLKDIFPQNAVDLGMFSSKGLLHTFFKRKEKKLYDQSDFIGCMSQANVNYLLKHNSWIDPKKVEICPNSIEPITIEKDETIIRKVREKYSIPMDKTIFIYGGNLGKPQGMEHIIACLKACADHPRAYFVIAGSGTEYTKLKGFLDQTPLSNVQLLYQLPKEDYELLANTCDVGLIFLDHRFTIPNFPSRLLSYMQASMPVLACTDVHTDIGLIIEQGQFGYWCESREAESFKEKIDQLCAEEEKLSEMGENARAYLETHYTVDQTYEIIMKHFEQEGPENV
jgi:glycosyltransferase involved in cell wall biosynthesis